MKNKITITPEARSKWSLRTRQLWEIENKLREELMIVLRARIKSQLKDNKKS